MAVEKSMKPAGSGKMYAQNAARMQAMSDSLTDVEQEISALSGSLDDMVVTKIAEKLRDFLGNVASSSLRLSNSPGQRG